MPACLRAYLCACGRAVRALSGGHGSLSDCHYFHHTHTPAPTQRLTHGMLYRKLGKSELVVSEVCLGTMTWGEQCTEEQAHAQLDMAMDEYGVNFVVRALV